jgi:integrase
MVTWRHKGRLQKQSCKTLAEALQVQGERRQSGAARAPTTRERFEDYALAWLDTYRGRTSRGVGNLILEDYRRSLTRYAIPYFDRYRLADVEPPDVRAFVSHLEAKGLAPATVRKVLAPVRAMLATAVEDGSLRANPCAGIRVSGRRRTDTDDAREIRALSRDELAALLEETPDEWRLFFELLAHTGLRISEAIGLQWGDVVYGDQPRVRVSRRVCRGKTGDPKSESGARDIPLSPGMARRLWPLRHGKAPDAPVFASRRGTPLHESNVRNRVLIPARKRAGLEWVTPHTFRHTCASLLFDAGKSVKQVSVWLGHADPAFTLRTYIHLMDDGLGDADFLDAAVSVKGNARGTQAPQTPANVESESTGEIAV